MDFKQMKTSKILLRFVIPQMIGLVFNSVYFIVDGVFIGRRLGSTALAAAGVAVPVVEMMIALSMFLSVGAGIIISAAFGKGDVSLAGKTFNLSVMLSLIFAALIAIPGNLFIVPLSRLLGAGDLILADTVTYLRYFLSFSPFLILSFTFSTYARNDGRPTLAMVAMTVGSLSNVLLDYMFMYPLNMGIAGAALATGLGPVFSVLILLPHFLRKKGQLHFKRPHWDFSLTKKMLFAGLPAFITEFSIGFVTLLYNLAIVRRGMGADGLAAYLVIGYAALICLTAFLGAAQGVQPVISYLKGAGDRARIGSLLKTISLFSGALGVLLYLLLAFQGGRFFGIFIENDPALLQLTAGIAVLYFLNLPFAALNLLLISFLQAMERAVESLLLSVSRSVVAVLLFLLILPAFWDQNGLWCALTFAEAVTLVAAAYTWRRMSHSKQAKPKPILAPKKTQL